MAAEGGSAGVSLIDATATEVTQLLITFGAGRGSLLRFESLIGRTYVIQSRDDLDDDWSTALGEIVGNGTLINGLDSGVPKTDSFPVAGQRTYRVVLAP